METQACYCLGNQRWLFLLVQEQGQSNCSLPGSGIEHNEPSLLAAVREVHEETRLKVSTIRYLGDLDGGTGMNLFQFKGM